MTVNTIRISGKIHDGSCLLGVYWPDEEFDNRAIPVAELLDGNGAAIYAAVFGRRPVAELCKFAAGESDVLRIELRVTGELVAVRFEEMTDPSGVALVTHRKLSLIRMPFGRAPAIAPVSLEDAPGALFIYADPSSPELPSLAADAYWRNLKPVLESFPMRVERRQLGRQELSALSRETRPVHLIHVLAHGRDADGGYIALQGAGSQVDWCPYAEFAESISLVPGLRAVVLHTCRSLPLGLLLTAKGLAVLAWNGLPSAALPSQFWPSFYGVELARELDVGDAARAARETLRNLGRAEWSQLAVCAPKDSAATAVIGDKLRGRLLRDAWAELGEATRSSDRRKLSELRPRPLGGGDGLAALTGMARAWSCILEQQDGKAPALAQLDHWLAEVDKCAVPSAVSRIYEEQREQLKVARNALAALLQIHSQTLNDRLESAAELGASVEKNLAAYPLAQRAVAGLVRARKEEIERILRYRRYLGELEASLLVLVADATSLESARWQELQIRAAFQAPWEESHAGPVATVEAQFDLYGSLFVHEKQQHKLLRQAIELCAEGVLAGQPLAVARALPRLAEYLVEQGTAAATKLMALGRLLSTLVDAVIAKARGQLLGAATLAAERQLAALPARAQQAVAQGRQVLAACLALREAAGDAIPAELAAEIQARGTAAESELAAPCAELVAQLAELRAPHASRVRALLAEGKFYAAVHYALGAAAAAAEPRIAAAPQAADLATTLDQLDAMLAELARTGAELDVDAAAVVRRHPALFANPTAPPLSPAFSATPLHPYLALARYGVRADGRAEVPAGIMLDEAGTAALSLLQDPEQRLRLDVWLFPIENPRRFEDAAAELRRQLLAGRPPEPPAGLPVVERAALHCLLGGAVEAAQLLWEALRGSPCTGTLSHALLLCLLAAADHAVGSKPAALAELHWRRMVACLGLLLRGVEDSYLERFCERRRVAYGSPSLWNKAALALAVEDELRRGVAGRLKLASAQASAVAGDPGLFIELGLALGAELEGAASLRELRGGDIGEGFPIACGRLAISELGLTSSLAQWFAGVCNRDAVRQPDGLTAAQRGSLEAVVRSFTELWRPRQHAKAGDVEAAEAALDALFPLAAVEPESAGGGDAGESPPGDAAIGLPLCARADPAVAASLIKLTAAGLWVELLSLRALSALPPAGAGSERRMLLVRLFRAAMSLARMLGDEQRASRRLAKSLVTWAQAWLHWLNEAPLHGGQVARIPLLHLRPIYHEFFRDDEVLTGALVAMHEAYAVVLSDVRREWRAAIDELEAALALRAELPLALHNLGVATEYIALEQAIRGDSVAALAECDKVLARLAGFLQTIEHQSVRSAYESLKNIRQHIADDDDWLHDNTEQLSALLFADHEEGTSGR